MPSLQLSHRAAAGTVVIALVGMFLPPRLVAETPAPIALSGYNADIVTEAKKSVRFAQPVDLSGAAWFEAGAVDDIGNRHNDGLPASGFASSYTNPLTGGHTSFAFQPFSANNALFLRYGGVNTGQLDFVEPAAFDTLAILAAGYNATPTTSGSLSLLFSDGTRSNPFPFNAFDWGFGASNVAIGGLGRNQSVGSDGKAFFYLRPVPFALYETDVDLVGRGLSGKTITGIAFTGSTDIDPPGFPSMSVFAVSGSGKRVPSVPEPGSLALIVAGLPAAKLRRRRAAAAFEQECNRTAA